MHTIMDEYFYKMSLLSREIHWVCKSVGKWKKYLKKAWDYVSWRKINGI
jgi:hypothetical protein